MASKKLDLYANSEETDDFIHLQRKVLVSKKKFKDHSAALNNSDKVLSYKKTVPYRKPKQKLSIFNFDE